MKTLGRLSRGISIGWKTGFDSGRSLDYVYRNRAEGVTPIGRLIDRLYLDSVGWKGIRERKFNLEKVLTETIERTHAAGRPVHLLDLAAGPGRYVLETLSFLPNIEISALLRDQVEANLEHGRRLAAQAGLHNVAFEQGDAFDADFIAEVTPPPTIAIVSGLYELFPDNAPVRRSLQGLARAIEPGGCLIYTNQPWHPQVEMIARVLPNRDGDPWVMRRRTQAEMDGLVADAGFRKIAMEMDRWGIFTVSVATREAS